MLPIAKIVFSQRSVMFKVLDIFFLYYALVIIISGAHVWWDKYVFSVLDIGHCGVDGAARHRAPALAAPAAYGHR